MTVALVACGRRKQPHTAPAKDLYTSDLFRKSSTYAARVADKWFVLSAKHGLVPPSLPVEPYDLSLNNLTRTERIAWSRRVALEFMDRAPAPTEVVVLAGVTYREHLIPLLESERHRVSVPMAGLGIGRQLAWLKDNLQLTDP